MTFRRHSIKALNFPGEESRETWLESADGKWQMAEQATGGTLGVEALAFDSAPFYTMGLDDKFDEAVALRWEGFSVTNEEGAHRWTCWPVSRKDKMTLVGTLALTESYAGTSAGDFHPTSFEPSASMLPLPENGLAVWQELGRYVVAFTNGPQLLHVAALTSRVLDADAAFELRDLLVALQTNGFLDELASIHVWSRCENDFVPQLACLFEDAAVVKEPRPEPRLPAEMSRLMPLQVALARKQSQARLNQLLLLAAAALVYLCFFGAWWLRLQWRESHLQQAELALSAKQPEVDLVQEAQSHWLEMEGAINPDLYPAELFHQIVSLLPDEGIRLKEFQIDDGRLIVSGEATTVNQALGFKDRLAGCEPLKRYAWNFPVPAIREDNRADFRAEGTLNGGPAHEGQ